jgi:hypothetical protein
MQVNPKIRQALIAVALVLFAAGSITAQIKRYPTHPANPDRVIVGAQAQTPDPGQANYTFVKIDPDGMGHCYMDAHALNEAGQVVVVWSDPDYPDCNVWHASLWDHGKWTSLDFVDPEFPDMTTYLTSLNERGIAFGTYWSYLPNFTSEPAAGINVKTGKWFVLPDIPGYPWNQGLSMSNNGLAVGGAVSEDGTQTKHWIWDGKAYIFPTFPAHWDVSAFWAGPEFINDSGEIAGQYVDSGSGRSRGYFQKGWHVTTFDAPGASGGTYVNDITNAGNVLLNGAYDKSSPYYPAHNFSWRQGVFTSLPNVPFPEAVLPTYVYGLNDRGDFSGRWYDGSGLEHAFVAYRNK